MTTIQARIAAEADAKRVADEQARIAAEVEAQRLAAEAAELARLAAAAESKRVADEQARIAAEVEAKRVADEQARIAAEAEAKRLAEEQARIAAQVEAKRVAEEQARIAAEVEAKRVADEQTLIAAAAEARRFADEQARIAAEAEARRIIDEQARVAAEAKAYKDALSFLADVNKSILANYGENMSKVALGLQDNISGKKVRSYADAMKTFEKVRINPSIRLNVQDTQAIAGAFKALDLAIFADNVMRLGKAFGVVGKIIQLNAVLEKTILGVESGNWKPLGLELESIGAGIGAGAILAVGMALFFPVFTASAAGLVTLAILMAMIAAYLDAQKVDEINSYILNTFS